MTLWTSFTAVLRVTLDTFAHPGDLLRLGYYGWIVAAWAREDKRQQRRKAPPDPTHGRIDRDIQTAVDQWGPGSLAQRVAVENTMQADRDRRSEQVYRERVPLLVPTDWEAELLGPEPWPPLIPAAPASPGLTARSPRPRGPRPGDPGMCVHPPRSGLVDAAKIKPLR